MQGNADGVGVLKKKVGLHADEIYRNEKWNWLGRGVTSEGSAGDPTAGSPCVAAC